MTVEEIVIAALARGLEFSNEVPVTRSVHYRRITVRQQQLFVRAAEINSDYFGVTASVALVAGVADLSPLTPAAERVAQVRINGVGTSPYVTGTPVNIIPIEDASYSGLAPRATLRDYKVTQVGADLALVASVWIDYSKRPPDLIYAADVPQLPAQFQELLVIDDTKWMIRRTAGMDKGLRTEAIASLEAEEIELVGEYEKHVERFQLAEESRFGRTARPLSRPRAEA